MIKLVEPKPKTHSDIGKTVIVFDRYRFAVPLKGRIQDVASKDGAYKVSFYSKQHGYPNYLQFDHMYFFAQQCQIVEEKEELKGIWVGNMKDGDVGVIVGCAVKCYVGRVVQRNSNSLITIGMSYNNRWDYASRLPNSFRVWLLEKGETLVVM